MLCLKLWIPYLCLKCICQGVHQLSLCGRPFSCEENAWNIKHSFCLWLRLLFKIGLHKFPRSLGTTSKFYVAEGWHESSSMLRTNISELTCETHWFMMFFVRRISADINFCMKETKPAIWYKCDRASYI